MRVQTVLVASLFSVGISLTSYAADPVASKPVSAAKPPVTSGDRPQRSVRQLLNQRLSDVKFEGVTLNDAIDFLRDASRANVHVNWKALEAAGVAKETVITTRLRNVPVRKALGVILAQAGGATQLAYYIDEGIIEITTLELADAQQVTRTYFVDDILMDIPNFAGPSFDLSNNNSGGGGKGGGGNSGGGGGLFKEETGDRAKGTTKTERADSLVSLITQTVRPEVWESSGGAARIKYFRGYLIITAPRSVHEAIGGPVE